jgi:cytochrome c oxidase cbb3-type subunit 3
VTVSSIPASAASSPALGAAAEPAPTADLLDHEYDGIREYDNPLPGWWVFGFWASFFFAIGYIIYYASGRGLSVADDYEQDMAAVRAERARQALGEKVSEAGLVKLMEDPALMKDAKGIFAQRCTPCHGEHGQGVIGPNLTDDHWLHGDSLLDIFHTVSEGVADKGMPAWKMQLSPVQVRELAAFVGSIRRQHLPGKAPEGTLVSEGL